MHSIIVPIFSLNEEWSFKPITTLQQKNICKVLLESADNNNIIKRCIDSIISECLQEQHKHLFNTITLLDKLIILLKLRCSSIGWEIELESIKDGRTIKHNYSFLTILEEAAKVSLKIKPLVIEGKNIYITCNIPSIQDENILNNFITESLTEENILCLFIRNIKIQENNINLMSLSYKERNTLLESLPTLFIQKIQQYTYETIEQLNTINLYTIFDTKINFNIFGKTYADYIKFLFQEDLFNLYQETYILTKHINMSANYVDNLTALEREVYISLLKQENQSQQQDATVDENTVNVPNNSIDSLDLYKQEKGG